MAKPTSVYINVAEFTWKVSKVLRGEPDDVVAWLTDFCDGLTGTNGVSEYADSLLHETNEYKRRDRERKRPAEKKVEEQPNQPKLLSAPTKETKPRAEKQPIDTADFERFWSAYPKERRIDKQSALKAWIKADPDINVVLSAIDAQKANWTDSNFIPHPTTWINKKRWEMPTEIVKKEPEEEDRIRLWKISLGMPL